MRKLNKFIKLTLILCASGVITTQAPSYSEQWDKNITTKIDVDTFWKEVKDTRKLKYGEDIGWDTNMDYCSYFAENIAKSKGEGYVMSRFKYADKCMNTLNFMTDYVLNEGVTNYQLNRLEHPSHQQFYVSYLLIYFGWLQLFWQ